MSTIPTVHFYFSWTKPDHIALYRVSWLESSPHHC